MKTQGQKTAGFVSGSLWQERALWMVFCLVTTTAAFETFLHIGRPWFEVVFFSRISLSALAALALIWLMGEQPLPRPSKAIYLGLMASAHALHLVLARESSLHLINLTGFFLVLAAFLFQGPITLWWRIVAPLGTIAALSPLSILNVRQIGLLTFFEYSATPAFCIAVAGAVGALRETRATSLVARAEAARLGARNSSLVAELRRLQNELGKKVRHPFAHFRQESEAVLRPVLELAPRPVESLSEALEQAAAVELHASDEGESAVTALAMGSVPVCELKEILDGKLEAAKAKTAQHKLRVVVSGSTDWSVPASVRGDRRELEEVLHSLVAHCADSIGGGEGTLRVSWRLGISTLTLTFEDNGRGMNEELLNRLERTGRPLDRLKFVEIRRKVEEAGGRIELNARLGVGSRVVLELPRVDAFAHAPARLDPSHSPRVAQIRQAARENIATPMAQTATLAE